jgi:hypothetical protein
LEPSVPRAAAAIELTGNVEATMKPLPVAIAIFLAKVYCDSLLHKNCFGKNELPAKSKHWMFERVHKAAAIRRIVLARPRGGWECCSV